MSDRRLLEINCKAFRFVPGDRIVVRLKQDLHPLEKKKLLERVRKWAGQDVEVLFQEEFLFDLEVQRPAVTRPPGLLYPD